MGDRQSAPSNHQGAAPEEPQTIKSEETIEEKASFLIHKFRVHYFFTECGVGLEEFCKDTQIEMRITTGEWAKPIAKSSCFPLTHFEFTKRGLAYDQGVVNKLQRFQCYFFGESVDKFYLNLTAGLKLD